MPFLGFPRPYYHIIFFLLDNYSGRNLAIIKAGQAPIKIFNEDQIWSLVDADAKKQVMEMGKLISQKLCISDVY